MVIMSSTPLAPTAKNVQAANLRYTQENELANQTLSELFQQFPGNQDPRYVLVKVIAINSLCHTNLFPLESIASHIHQHHLSIDEAISKGSPDGIDLIAKVTIKGKPHNFYSFATKFCSWHNSDAYPAYDSHVDHCLWSLQKQNPFSAFHHADLWNYPRFLQIMQDFRSFYGVTDFSWAEINNFLYVEGAPPPAPGPDFAQDGPGAFDFYPTEQTTA